MLAWLLVALSVVVISPLAAEAGEEPTPLPLPKTIRVQSAAPRERVWQTLSPTDRELVIHLTRAADAGRTLLFLRSHRHALLVKQLLEEALSPQKIAETKALLGEKPFDELLRYAAKFFDQSGPYAASNRKYILSEVTPAQIDQLANLYLSQAGGATRKEVVRLLTDPKFEVLQYPENQEGEGLEKTGGNFYEHGVTGKEVHAVFDKTSKLTLNGESSFRDQFACRRRPRAQVWWARLAEGSPSWRRRDH